MLKQVWRHRRSQGERGAFLTLLAIFMPGLLLISMLAVDGFIFVESDIQLHNAVESAAEAGLCHYLEHGGTLASTTGRVENVLQKVWMITKKQQDLSATIDILEPGLFDESTKNFTALPWGNGSINALRVSANHESGSGSSISGFFSHLVGLGGVTLTNDVVAYRVDPSLDTNDYVYRYRFHHCPNNTCS